MKCRFTIVLVVFVLATNLQSCGSRGENRKIMEAAVIHRDFMQRHDSLFNALTAEKERVTGLLQTEKNKEKIQAYESMNRSLDRSFRLLSSWEEAVIGVPGVEHDHNGHNHDHSNDDLIDDMSDKEILELQKAYSMRLDEVNKKIKELLTTIELYSQNAN